MRQNNFTPLRLLLALLVVLGHFQLLAGVASPPFPFNYASFAVDGFFVVSGFLVSSSFDRDPDLWRFYVRRLFRIYPLYLLVILAQTAVLAALTPGGPAANAAPLLRYFAANAVFANFLHYDAGRGVLAALHTPGLNPSLWTLKIEVGFYLILPFLWLAFRRMGVGVLVGVFAASAAYYAGMRAAGQYELAKQLPGQLQFFVLGMAGFAYGGRVRIPRALACLAALALAVCVTLMLRPHPPVLYPLAVGALVLLAALYLPVVRLQADISFGVYLLHAPLIQLALLSGLYRPGLPGLAVLIVVTLALALLAERWIEMPCIALGRHLTRRRATPIPIQPYAS